MVKDEPRPWRFNELQSDLEVSGNTLSRRLDELVETGLLTRQQYDEIPPRVEYEATVVAKDLAPVFEALGAWAERHELVGVRPDESDGPPSQDEQAD